MDNKYNKEGKKMTSGRIREIAETYINGNIYDAKVATRKMSKIDLLEFLDCLASYYYQTLEDGQGNKLDGYAQAINAVKRLLN